MKMTPARRLPLSQTENARDLGGYWTMYGKTTQFGRFLRSNLPRSLSDQDLNLLWEWNVRTIIDLRTEKEVKESPSPYHIKDKFSYYNLPFLKGNRDPVSAEDVSAIYLEMLSSHDSVRRIMEAMADTKGAVLFHCYAGKDRTGVVAALLLLLAGVDLSDILADYEVSYTYLRKTIRQMRLKHPEWGDFFERTNFEFMETALEELLNQFGTVEQYLMQCGISEETIRRLRAQLLDP